MSANYNVIVGNIGTVYDGTSESDAIASYDEYAKQSRDGRGRAAGEPVTLLRDDEPIKECEPMLNVLSIDAWSDGEGGWQWNQWFKIGTISKSDFEALDTDWKTLKWFKDNGFTTSHNSRLASVEDDGHNVCICDRSDGRPLFAIEYGNRY